MRNDLINKPLEFVAGLGVTIGVQVEWYSYGGVMAKKPVSRREAKAKEAAQFRIKAGKDLSPADLIEQAKCARRLRSGLTLDEQIEQAGRLRVISTDAEAVELAQRLVEKDPNPHASEYYMMLALPKLDFTIISPGKKGPK